MNLKSTDVWLSILMSLSNQDPRPQTQHPVEPEVKCLHLKLPVRWRHSSHCASGCCFRVPPPTKVQIMGHHLTRVLPPVPSSLVILSQSFPLKIFPLPHSRTQRSFPVLFTLHPFLIKTKKIFLHLQSHSSSKKMIILWKNNHTEYENSDENQHFRRKQCISPSPETQKTVKIPIYIICQKNTKFDSFSDICHFSPFSYFPLFPFSTFFHILPIFRTVAELRFFTNFPKYPIFHKNPIFPKYPIFDHFPKNPKIGLFPTYPQKPYFPQNTQKPQNTPFSRIPHLPPFWLFWEGDRFTYPKGSAWKIYFKKLLGVLLYSSLNFSLFQWICKSLIFSQFHNQKNVKKMEENGNKWKTYWWMSELKEYW